MKEAMIQPWQMICIIGLVYAGFMALMILKGALQKRTRERDASWRQLSMAKLLLLELKGLVLQLVGLKLGNRAEQQRLRDLVTRIEELTGQPLRHQKEARRKWAKSSESRRGSATAAGKKGIRRPKTKRRPGSKRK